MKQANIETADQVSGRGGFSAVSYRGQDDKLGQKMSLRQRPARDCGENAYQP